MAERRSAAVGTLPAEHRWIPRRRREGKTAAPYRSPADRRPDPEGFLPWFGCLFRRWSTVLRLTEVHPEKQRRRRKLPSGSRCWEIHGRIPLVKDIVLSECQFRLTLRFFLLINLTDETVVNLYFLFTKAAIVFNSFMDHNFLNHVIQQF